MQTSVVCKTRNKGQFLESPRSFLGLESYFVFAVFTFKIKTFNNFDNDTMKLSVNKAKLTGLWARNCTTIQQVLFLKIAFGPEKFPRFSGNGPQARNTPRTLSQDTPAHPGTPPKGWILPRTLFIYYKKIGKNYKTNKTKISSRNNKYR